MQKLKLVAGLLGCSGVALGAFGAHGFKAALTARGTVATWDTAVLYHLIHVAAIWTVAARSTSDVPFLKPAWAWAAGIVLFSGSLYALALGGPRWLGPVTPLGGAVFLVGWGLVAYDALRKEKA